MVHRRPEDCKVRGGRDKWLIPANVKHWHGAAPDAWFSHLAVEVAGEETSAEWLEAVSEEDYSKLK